MLKRIFLHILFTLSVVVFHAQGNENVFLRRDYNSSYQAEADTSEMMHTSIKPYLKREFKENKKIGAQPLSKKHLSILPLLDLLSGMDFSNGNLVGFEGAGLNAYFEPHTKVGFNVQYNYLQTGGLIICR